MSKPHGQRPLQSPDSDSSTPSHQRKSVRWPLLWHSMEFEGREMQLDAAPDLHRELSPQEVTQGSYGWAKDSLCNQTLTASRNECEEYISRYGDDIMETISLLFGLIVVLILLHQKEKMLSCLKRRTQRLFFCVFILGVILIPITLWFGEVRGAIRCCSYPAFDIDFLDWRHSSPLTFSFFFLGLLSIIVGLSLSFLYRLTTRLFEQTIGRIISWVRAGST